MTTEETRTRVAAPLEGLVEGVAVCMGILTLGLAAAALAPAANPAEAPGAMAHAALDALPGVPR